MVLLYFGLRTNRARLRRVLGASDFGTPAPSVLNLARLGIRVTFRSESNEQVLRRWLNQGIPPICMVDTGAFPHWGFSTAHAIVLVELDDNHAVLNDPAFPDARQTVSTEAFLLAWADHDYQYAILQPH